jgi:hypothetical protein
MGKVEVDMRISSGDYRVCRSNHSSKLVKMLLQYGLSVLLPLSKSNIQWFSMKHNTYIKKPWYDLSIQVTEDKLTY